MYRFTVTTLFVGALWGQSNQSPQDLLKQAVEFQQQGKLEEAIHGYSLFLDMYPDASAVRSNLGAALAGAGRYGEAIEQYKRSLGARPDNGVRFNLALAYYKAAQFADATRELKVVHDADPSDHRAVMLLADCALRQGENKTAIDLLTPLSQASPGDLGVAYLLGTALARNGDVAQSQLVISPILRDGDSAESRLLMGTTKYAARDFKGAIEDLAKAAELNPKLPDVYSYYGLALFVTGDLIGSRKAFESALQQDPNDFEANLHLGLMHRQDEDYDRAATYLSRAAAVRPSDLATQYQIALVNLAKNKLDQAQAGLETVIEKAPNFTEAHVSLATVYYRQKRKDDGDKQRAIVQQLNETKQAQQPGAKLSAAEEAAEKAKSK
jgi:tetratricopeptide (TPR) repeat protein